MKVQNGTKDRGAGSLRQANLDADAYPGADVINFSMASSTQLRSAALAGFVAFTFNGPVPPAGADFITAMATDPMSNTSEFSAAAS